jgi:hypothetical protein
VINESAASGRKPLFNLMDQKKLCRKERDLRSYFVSRFTPWRALIAQSKRRHADDRRTAVSSSVQFGFLLCWNFHHACLNIQRTVLGEQRHTIMAAAKISARHSACGAFVLKKGKMRRLVDPSSACRRTAALGVEKCMREKLFGLKRELTLRNRLRRHVNELIRHVKFTSSERSEFIPEAAISG